MHRDHESTVTGLDALLTSPWTDDGSHALLSQFPEGTITPTIRVAPLASSEDFFDDDDGSQAQAAWAEFEPAAQRLVQALAARYGPPTEVDVLGQARFEDGEFRGEVTSRPVV